MTKNAATSTKPSLVFEGHVKRIDAGTRRISEDEEKREIDKFLQSSRSFKQKVESVGADFERHRKGHRATYELLQEIYTVALELENSPAKYAVLRRLRQEIKDEGRKVDDAASSMSVLLKYVVPESSRQLVHIYNRVLRVAQAEGIEPEKLADEIEKRDGGMSGFSRTPKQAAAAKQQAEQRAERLVLFKRYLTRVADEGKTVEWDTFIDLTKRAPGELFFFVGVPAENGTFKLSHCLQLDETQENLIAASLCSAMGTSDEEMRAATQHTQDGGPAQQIQVVGDAIPEKTSRRKGNELLA